MDRIAVIGCPGTGKTTVAASIADKLGHRHIELDSIAHQTGWVEMADAEFRRRVDDQTASGRWICDGNYNRKLGGFLTSRADTIVFLDLPRGVVMRRVIARTLRRAITRKELWNGNHEPLSNLYRWDPEHNIMRWAWVHHPIYREEYRRAARDGSWNHLQVVHLRSQAEVDSWLTAI